MAHDQCFMRQSNWTDQLYRVQQRAAMNMTDGEMLSDRRQGQTTTICMFLSSLATFPNRSR